MSAYEPNLSIKHAPAPTANDEESNPLKVDGFYERCGNWLRERTLDTTKFEILFEENKTYGFCRNLFGVKLPALTLNMIVVLICLLILSRKAVVPVTLLCFRSSRYS
ncbi:hypothetical protein [Mesorhizobium sp. f-mel]